MAELIPDPKARSSSARRETGGTEPSAIFLPVPAEGDLQGQEASHPLQEGVVLRVALWVLMGGAAAESILASKNEPPVA